MPPVASPSAASASPPPSTPPQRAPPPPSPERSACVYRDRVPVDAHRTAASAAQVALQEGGGERPRPGRRLRVRELVGEEVLEGVAGAALDVDLDVIAIAEAAADGVDLLVG